MTAYVHLVEGDSAAVRLARVAQLSRASRCPVIVFAETSEPPCSPLDWLMGAGCNCCLPTRHPRLRLIHASEQPGSVRIVIDAGPPVMADRIADMLAALPVRLSLNLIAA